MSDLTAAPSAGPAEGLGRTATGRWFLARSNLQVLIDLLRDDGRTVIAPTVVDGTIVLDQIESVDELPAGWRDEQAPGRYRLTRDGSRLFDFTVGPSSAKRWTFPPRVPQAVATREEGVVRFDVGASDVQSVAFLGLRACELAALGVQDRVFLGGPYTDEDYRARRAAAIVIAVECAVAGATCFCTSMGTGPAVRGGADLVLSELDDGFVVRAGTPVGSELLARLPLKAATSDQLHQARQQVEAVAEAIGEPVATQGLHERLLAQWDSPQWLRIAERCMTCGNCTLVCPTCFCSSVTQRSDLDGTVTTNQRIWDSCFTLGFAKVAGGNFRSRARDRYRQWLTHKFATWVDQFGSFGCVGCGRCVTWCPVGIDVRAELAAVAPPVETRAADLGPAATTPAAYTVARVRSIRPDTSDTSTLVLDRMDPAFPAGAPGQFVMVDLPGFPPLPISISRYRSDGIELTIRAAGPATTQLTQLARGDEIGLRGPLGTSWPIERAVGRDIVIVTGGIGLPPLRPAIDAILAQRLRFGAVRLYYGARTPKDLMFVDELERWGARDDMEVSVTVDRAGPEWTGPVGVVTHLFDRATWDGSRTVAFVVGPERMMTATAEVLHEHGLSDDRIFVSMERHMECGIGLCGHCQMGPYFVCKDGPVFSLAQLTAVFGREGM
ncbi:MAG TPA: 4Fe-4S dicluster domain-containing protein [Candidatus Dormibacteraeota bacterium]|nr:4Fe-4S dicluster domain-containing protein [Candidatus Dormibacteraeota bacterium]